jgi:hypothetical protein
MISRPQRSRRLPLRRRQLALWIGALTIEPRYVCGANTCLHLRCETQSGYGPLRCFGPRGGRNGHPGCAPSQGHFVS